MSKRKRKIPTGEDGQHSLGMEKCSCPHSIMRSHLRLAASTQPSQVQTMSGPPRHSQYSPGLCTVVAGGGRCHGCLLKEKDYIAHDHQGRGDPREMIDSRS